MAVLLFTALPSLTRAQDEQEEQATPDRQETPGAAKTAGPTSANPPRFFFVLRTKTNQKLFHLGEMIEIEEDYSSAVPGAYLLLQSPRFHGGASPVLGIQPGDSVIDRFRNTGRVSASGILYARCSGGIGSGSSGDCFDCDHSFKLGLEPIRFPYFLNYRFALTAPGRYTFQLTAANIASASAPTKPIPVISTPLEIEIVRDDAWSHQQLQSAVERFQVAYEKYFWNGWNKRYPREDETIEQSETAQQIQLAADTIRFLDTEESLREAVRLFDGSPQLGTYDNLFLHAILETSHRDLAVSLLADRITEPDFIVSEDFLDLLTAMTIQVENSVAFAREDRASLAQLTPRALEILRDYLLALGRSLPSKQGEARTTSAATFSSYASHDYCTGSPVLEKHLADQLLAKSNPN